MPAALSILIQNQVARLAQSLTLGTLVHFRHFKRFVMSGILTSYRGIPKQGLSGQAFLLLSAAWGEDSRRWKGSSGRNT
jgi:hypothetical protein